MKRPSSSSSSSSPRWTGAGGWSTMVVMVIVVGLVTSPVVACGAPSPATPAAATCTAASAATATASAGTNNKGSLPHAVPPTSAAAAAAAATGHANPHAGTSTGHSTKNNNNNNVELFGVPKEKAASVTSTATTTSTSTTTTSPTTATSTVPAFTLLRGGELVEPTSAEEVDDVVEEAAVNELLVVIDFTASWCGPCKAIAPLYKEMSEEYDTVVFLKVDVDETPDTAAKYSVSAMPTFLFLKGGKVVDRLQGANPQKLRDMIEQYM